MFWKKEKTNIWDHDTELEQEVDRPQDTQSEFGRMSNDCNISMDGFNGMKVLPCPSKPRSMSKPGLGELLKTELMGKSFLNFHVEPHTEKLRKRIVSKNGGINIGKTKISKRKRQYFRDLFNTMLDIQWRYVHLLFLMSFMLSWLGFALFWFLICHIHGDFEEDHLPHNQESSGWTPCVLEVKNFASVFLFSIETQHTIGYGSRQTSEECPEAIILMCIQSVAGVMIQACMVGIIFSKLSRPKARSQTLMFSKNAVVCRRDGNNCLLFRVGNMRNSSLVEAHVRAILISKRVTEEGEVQPYHQTELKVGTDPDGEEDCLFFIWPTTITHKIDEDSPFYNMSARDFFKKRYEIVVMIEGVVEQTGNSVQARSSYLPNEVLWGYRFVNLLNFKQSAAEYKVDFTAFNAVYKVTMDSKSQKEREDEEEDGDEESENKNPTSTTQSSVMVTPSPLLSTPSTTMSNDRYRSCVEILHMV